MYNVVFVVILKYYVSLWVQNWDIIQILELNTLNCHNKGLKMSRLETVCFELSAPVITYQLRLHIAFGISEITHLI